MNAAGRLRFILALSASALALWLPGRWAYRETELHYAAWKISRQFTPGMTRQDIEDKLLTGRRRFWRGSSDDYVSLGYEVSYGIACAPDEVALRLEFKPPDAESAGADVLRKVQMVRKARGCM